jgi:hypothetical protein
MLRSNPFPHDVEALEGWFLAVPLERVFGRARSEIYGSLEVVSELIVEAQAAPDSLFSWTTPHVPSASVDAKKYYVPLAAPCC